jgi:hypothetical protein
MFLKFPSEKITMLVVQAVYQKSGLLTWNGNGRVPHCYIAALSHSDLTVKKNKSGNVYIA